MTDNLSSVRFTYITNGASEISLRDSTVILDRVLSLDIDISFLENHPKREFSAPHVTFISFANPTLLLTGQSLKIEC